jgi:DNA-binding Lrp family transcriptional regulator
MNDKNYFVVQGWMVNQLKLSGNDLLVYAIIYGFSQDGESKYKGSGSYIAKSLGISRRTVSLVLNDLVEKGYIKKFDYYDRNIKLCDYQADPDFFPQISPKEGMEKISMGRKNLPGGCQADPVSPPQNPPKEGEIPEQGMEKISMGEKNLPGGMEKISTHKAIDKNSEEAAAADQSFPEIEKPHPETAAAGNSAQEIKKLKSHFLSLSRLLLFDEWFYPKILKHLSKNKLGFDFVSWMYKYCIKQEPDNITNYFFKVFLQPRFVELFKASGLPPAPARRQPESVPCPVCGAVHFDSDEFCPQCKFLSSSAADQKEIHYCKTLFLMPPEVKEQYYAECDQVLRDFKNFKEIETHRLSLDKKYGLILDSA